MFTLLIFIAVLAVLVLTHEFGHFIVARKNGIKVDEFGFGFPPRVAGIRRLNIQGQKRWQIVWGKREEGLPDGVPDATLYSFNLVPLGGFVKIKGENATEEGSHEPDSFAMKKTWQKASVLVAGVVMNILTAAVLLSVGYMIGMPEAVTEGVSGLKEQHLQIVHVLPGKPAEKAGLQLGDQILKVNQLSNPSLVDFQNIIAGQADKPATIVVQRDGATQELHITPTLMSETGKAGIGIALAEVGIRQYPWYQAIYHGTIDTGRYTRDIFLAFGGLIKGLFSGQGVGEAVAGPVGVAVMTGEVARLGIIYLIQFTALLSLNLAVLNILPIPALDGGRLFFVLLGRVFRRTLTPRFEQLVHSLGFLLLMLLVVIVTVKDIGMFKGLFIDWWQKVF